MEGWTGMGYLPEGDMREARNRAKFPRWGNRGGISFSKSPMGALGIPVFTEIRMFPNGNRVVSEDKNRDH